MKIKPSRQPGHVVFDVGAGDLPLLDHVENEPEMVSTVVEEETTYRDQLAVRANKRTALLDEILSRTEALVSLELKRAKLNRS